MIDPYKDYDLTGRVAVLTGGGSGIGACSAELLASAGAAVVLGDVDIAAAEAVAAKIRGEGGKAVAQATNVAIKAEVEALGGRAVAAFGRLDIMGNIAGIMNTDLVVDVTEEILERVIAVNQKGVFFGCQAALRVMIPQGSGSIINVASAAIDYPNSNVSVYAMTKAAVAMLTRELAIEAGPYGIRVNSIAPGSTPTNFNAQGRKDEAGNVDQTKLQVYLDRNTEMSPIGRVGEAIDQAHLIHYLASDASKFATGATFRANGGVGLVW